MGTAISGHNYAQMLGGVVHWLFTEADLPEWNDQHIIVADITNVAPAPAVGWTATETNGVWSFVAPAVPVPTVPEKAAAAIYAGLPVTSTADGALGTFSLDLFADVRFVSRLQYYRQFGSFPNKATTQVVRDVDDNRHALSAAQYEALYQTLGDYLSALEDCLDGASTVLPDPTNFGSIP